MTVKLISLAIGFFLIAAQDKKQPEPQKPGPEHELLKSFEGTWDADVTHCVEHGKGAQVKGVETAAVSLGGFWLISDFRSQMDGKSLDGHSILGYDQASNAYVIHWFGSMCSTPTVLQGMYDWTGRTLTMTGDHVGPDGKPGTLKAIYALKDSDHYDFKLIWTGADAQECPCMTIAYSKRR